MSALTIARVELVRLFRDRSNLFFVLILPLLLVVFIGIAFGAGFDARVGVVATEADPAVIELVAAIDDLDNVVAVEVADESDLTVRVSRGLLTAGLVVPAGYGSALEGGDDVELGYVGRADSTARSIRAMVEAVVEEQSAVVEAGRVAADVTGGSATELAEHARALQDVLPGVEVRTEAVGGDPLAQEFAGLGQFDLGASSQLFLFVFLTSLSAGSALIQTRQYGIARRMLATPTPLPAILLGQAGGRFLVALVQAGYIVAATLLLFGVNWGDPLATGLVVLLFAAAAAGAGMLVGSVFSNDSQAAGVGVGLGLVLAALGGSMMPLELFSGGMRVVARFTPHAWANEAMAEIVRRGGGVPDVVTQLAMLAVFAVVLIGAAMVALRRTLTR